MQTESITMPFVHRKSTQSSHEAGVNNARLAQITIWTKFNNRRNSARIQHYFQKLHEQRMALAYNLIGILLSIIVIILAILLIRKKYQQFEYDQSDAILDIYFCELHGYVASSVLDPTFFSAFFPMFFTNPYRYPLSEENAVMFAKSFLYAYQTGGGYISYWNLGDESGRLIGFDTLSDTDGSANLIYCSGTNQQAYMWTSTFDSINESYPHKDGYPIDIPNVIDTDWFIAGYNSSGPLISDLYIRKTQKYLIPQFSVVIPGINYKTGATDFVSSFDLTLNTVQKLLRSLNVSKNSRLAITTAENILIAVTGEDQPVDAFNNEIITKEISELEDPVWSCVSSDDSFFTTANFSKICEIYGSSIYYNVFRSEFSVGEMTNWTFTVALESRLHSEIHEKEYYVPFIIALVLALAGWLILYVLYMFARSCFHTAQRKMLSHNTKIDKNHVKTVGVKQALHELRLVQMAHNDSSELKHAIANIQADFLQSAGNILTDEAVFLNRIENDRVKEKFQRMFDLSDVKGSRIFFETGAQTPMGNTTASFSPNAAQNIFNWDAENQIQLTVTAISLCNNYFDIESFESLIHDKLTTIPAKFVCLASEAIRFTNILLKYKLGTMLCDSDLKVALFISIISYQCVMEDKRESPNTFDRLFIKDQKKVLNFARNIITALYDTRTDQNEDRWTNMCEFVYVIIQATPVSKHPETIFSSQVFLSANLQHIKLSKKESLMMMKLLYITSIISFLFNSANSQGACSLLGINSSIDDEFYKCLNDNLISQEFKALQQILGTKYMSHIQSH